MKFFQLGAIALAMSLSFGASADTLSVGTGSSTPNVNGGLSVFTDTPGEQVGFSPSVGYSLVTDSGTINGGAFAGEFLTNYPGMSSFASYCTSISTSLNVPSPYTAIATDTMDGIARLFAAAGFIGQGWSFDGVSATQTSALQVAIWEVSEDGLAGANLLGGNLSFTQIDAGVQAQAQAYLSAANGLSAGQYNPNLLQFISSPEIGSQPLVTTVPEPSTYALMAACLGIVGWVARRKSV